MERYWNLILVKYKEYADYLWKEIFFQYTDKPWWENYFWWLVLISGIFFLIEWVLPWRKKQPKFRKDFWLDFWYMFFNFFVFSLLAFNALSYVFVNLFQDFLMLFGIKNVVAISVKQWPWALQLLTMFVVRDFIQWWVHRLLHRVPFLWEFHKVHHSVQQMGFAAHLRFHWMETVVYRTIEYLPLAMIGFSVTDFFIVHIFTLAVGHFNHSNFNLNLGPLKYIFNNPAMHIWHHAKEMPATHRYGINFGLTLSIWDYLFGTAVIPHNGRDIELGFEGVEEFPDSFLGQMSYGFGKKED